MVLRAWPSTSNSKERKKVSEKPKHSVLLLIKQGAGGGRRLRQGFEGVIFRKTPRFGIAANMSTWSFNLWFFFMLYILKLEFKTKYPSLCLTVYITICHFLAGI